MEKENKWEDFYRNVPLDKIPWQRAGDDYLKKVINSGLVQPGTALDLGCGTGMKSIFLAENGFEVTGVDISKRAIEYADKNASEAGVGIDFKVADASNLSFLGDKKFDFILDWANLHGIVEEKREQYISEIVEHTKASGKLLLRCFGREDGEAGFVDRPMGRVYIFSESDIKNLYGNYFKIIKTRNSAKPPANDKIAPSKFFYEFLMEKL